jgi:hypothetical protein
MPAKAGIQGHRRRRCLPFSPCGRRWIGEAETDEGYSSTSSDVEEISPLIRPSGTFSHKGRRVMSGRCLALWFPTSVGMRLKV